MPAPRPLPRPQYKYLKREHAESFLSDGLVRIGTLYDYRRAEAHGPAIGDEAEGTLTVYSDDDVHWDRYEDAPEFYKQVLGGKADNIAIRGIEFQQRHVVTDVWMYCTSLAYSRAAMKAFECEVCIRINNPGRFFQTITRALNADISQFLWGRCVYEDRRIHHRSTRRPHPGFLKDPAYAYQKELRAVWLPHEQPVTPRFLTLPELVPACTVYEP